MNAISELYSAPRSSLKRKLSRKRPETKDTAQADEPQEAPKVLGPYENKDKWRLVVKSGDKRKSLVFDTFDQAETAKGNLLASFDDSAKLTVGDLLAQFIEHKRQRGCVDRSLLHVKHTIMRILPKLDKSAHMSAEKAEALYLATVDKYAVASHAIALRTVKAMYRFAIKKKLVAKNPFDDVQSIGRANKGKLQLRTDEAKRLTDYLTELASLGDWRALALLTQLFLGLRSSEVLKLKKRDLDCDASVIVGDGTKTKNAKRRLVLDAPIVRELLRRRAEADDDRSDDDGGDAEPGRERGRAVDEQVALPLTHLPWPRVRRRLMGLIVAADTELAAEQAARARRGRFVRVKHNDDGTSWLLALLTTGARGAGGTAPGRGSG